MEQSPQDPERLLQATRRPDGEIPLADIWAMIATRRRLVAIVALTGAVLSAAVAVVRPVIFRYSSPVLIGTRSERLVENPETVRIKLVETYVPAARAEYAREHPDAARRVPIVEVQMPPGSAVLLLESEGPVADESIHAEVHTNAIQALARDHMETLEQQRALLERRLHAAEQAAAQAQGQLDTLNRDAERLSVQEKTLAGELLVLREWLASSERRSTDEALTGLRQTRAMSPPRRSPAPLGPSRLTVAAAGAGGSLVAGVLAALAVGLVKRNTIRPPQT
ncbi:MAG: hypothetical protein AB7Q29_02690 [Vicinamibacterales bacterium]